MCDLNPYIYVGDIINAFNILTFNVHNVYLIYTHVYLTRSRLISINRARENSQEREREYKRKQIEERERERESNGEETRSSRWSFTRWQKSRTKFPFVKARGW